MEVSLASGRACRPSLCMDERVLLMGTSEPGGTGERLTEQTSSPDGRTVRVPKAGGSGNAPQLSAGVGVGTASASHGGSVS
jgi:hypothetical protein